MDRWAFEVRRGGSDTYARCQFTSLVRLVARMLDPQSGDMGSNPIRGTNMRAWRNGRRGTLKTSYHEGSTPFARTRQTIMRVYPNWQREQLEKLYSGSSNLLIRTSSRHLWEPTRRRALTDCQGRLAQRDEVTAWV